jgi:hypothetical protein
MRVEAVRQCLDGQSWQELRRTGDDKQKIAGVQQHPK